MNHKTEETALFLELLTVAESVKRRLDQSLGAVLGITFSEYQLLQALAVAHKQSATRVTLAADVKRTPSGVTRALKPLEKLSYLKTSKDARDARRSLAVLTPQGVEIVDNAADLIADTLSEIGELSTLTADETSSLMGFLRRLS